MITLFVTLFLTLPVTLMITLIGGRERTLFLTPLVTLTITLFIAPPGGNKVPPVEWTDSTPHEKRHSDPRGVAFSRNIDIHHHTHAPSPLVRHPLHGGPRAVLLRGDDI